MTVLNLVKQRYETITKAQNKINKERVCLDFQNMFMSLKWHRIVFGPLIFLMHEIILIKFQFPFNSNVFQMFCVIV